MAIDWGDAPAWTALVVALGSLGVATWAAVESRRSRQASERSAGASEDSAQSADRSADAGEVSAQAAVRSADAAEKAHQLAEQQYLDSIPPAVAWEVQPTKKFQYNLVNVGTDTATGVAIDGSSLPSGRNLPTNATVSGNGGYVPFRIWESMQEQAPNEVLVSWDGASAPVPVPLHKF